MRSEASRTVFQCAALFLCIGLTGCFDEIHLGPHACDACRECETCVAIVAGVAQCAPKESEGVQCGTDGNVHAVNACGDLGDVMDGCENAYCANTSATKAECKCRNRWEGDDCATCAGNWDPDQDCGQCKNHWGGADCDECPANWDAEQDCAVCPEGSWITGAACVDIDECATDPCGAHGSCTNGVAVYTCNCDAGYRGGDSLACTDVDECDAAKDPCGSHGTCQNQVGSYACDCDSGYQVAHGKCVDIDECEAGLCGVHSSCTNAAGSYSCTCKDGFASGSGANCVDIDECAPATDPCAANRTCVNVVGDFDCVCDAGYDDVGGTCVDINECASGNGGCDLLTTCMNEPGSRTCGACPGGYTGDGEAGCTDVNECTTNNGGCDPLVVCTNELGSTRTCGACPVGYAGDGEAGCYPDCAVDNGGCDTLVTCTNPPGTRTCGACPAGYAGTGDTECIPTLVALDVSVGALSPVFSPTETSYTVSVSATRSIQLTPSAVTGVTIQVDGMSVTSGTSSQPIPLVVGPNDVIVTVAAPNHTPRDYTVTIVVAWVQDAYVKASNTEPGDAFGWSVALSGDTLAVGAYWEDSSATGVAGAQNNGASSSGAVYVFTRTAGVWSQQAYVKASNTGTGDYFGWSVALSGDTLAVGAMTESSSAIGIGGDEADNGASASGAVYVFTRTGGVWSQQAYVKASNTGAGDTFGRSVALSGDTLAVGADREASSATGIGGNQADNGAAFSGAVYVFTRTAGVWSQQAYVKASNTQADDDFGTHVALSGDTLAVGATGEDSSATGIGGSQLSNTASNSGAVYVFARAAGVWSQQAYVKASNAAAGDRFGESLALSGATLAVGADDEDSSATGIGGNQLSNAASDSGAVYVFTGTAGVWSQQAYVKASNTGASDHFGESLALSGATLAVGAYGEDSAATGIGGDQLSNAASNSGAVYVFTRAAGKWSQEAYVKASNTQADDFFGWSVALSDDTIAVGVEREDSAATGIGGNESDNSALQSGAVYVFR